jgi:radical SAM superfamily enzyme YgiQ (UPF0313 family)
MPKVLFINPNLSLNQRYGFLEGAGGVEVPSGICYLAACLRSNGISTEIIDAQALEYDEDKVLRMVIEKKPRYVGLSATTPQINASSRLAKKIKNSSKDITIIIGGYHVSALPSDTLLATPSFDYGIIGEGEYALLELLSALEEKRDFGGVGNLALRDHDQILVTGRRPRIVDLDRLPMPAYDLLPELQSYYRVPLQNTQSFPTVSLTTARGCSGLCTFCDRSVFGNQVTFHSAQYIVQMLKVLKNRFGIRNVMFQDDNFLALKDRFFQFCDLIRKNRLDMRWSAQARLDNIDDRILTVARQSGCWQLSFGIESFSQRMLNAYCKRIELKKIDEALLLTKKNGILTKGFFIFGGPGETEETLQESISYLRRAALNDISVTFFTPYPGSQSWEVRNTSGRCTHDFDAMTCFQVVFVPRGMSEEKLRFYHRKALRVFYFRGSVVLSYLKRINSLRFLIYFLRSIIALARHELNARKSPRVIINADDFGLSKDINRGVIKGYREGIVTSASLSPNGQEFEDAVDLLKENSGLDIGLHLTLIEEKAILEKQRISSLVDNNGIFYKDYRAFLKAYFFGKINMREVERELEAQFCKMREKGLCASHVDSHQHIHMLPGIMEIVVKLAEKYGIPGIRYPYVPLRILLFLLKKDPTTFIMRIGLNCLCMLYGVRLRVSKLAHPYCYCNLSEPWVTVGIAERMLTSVKENIWEFSVHPAIETDSLRSRYGHWRYNWKQDLDIVTNREIKDLLDKKSISLFNFLYLSEKNG